MTDEAVDMMLRRWREAILGYPVDDQEGGQWQMEVTSGEQTH